MPTTNICTKATVHKTIQSRITYNNVVGAFQEIDNILSSPGNPVLDVDIVPIYIGSTYVTRSYSSYFLNLHAIYI